MRRDPVAWLALAAAVLFVTSLLLPAFELRLFGQVRLIHGWQAMAAGLQLLARTADPYGLLLGSSGALNIVFFATPWLALGKLGRATPVIALLALAGLSLALAAPHLLDRSPPIRAGYPIWIAAYLCLLAAAILRLRDRPRRAADKRDV